MPPLLYHTTAHTHLRALIKSSHPLYFQFTHHIKQHNMFAYQNVKATLLRHMTKTFYAHTPSNTNVHHIDKNIIIQTTNRTHQTTHRINSYRNIKTSEFFSTSFSFATNFNPYQYIFLHIHTCTTSTKA
jgi:3'-phosphoadenosine 5'-phosphosulfate (PAPS) 3'-phosphatase